MKTLEHLCVQYGTDKHGHHDYAKWYNFHFKNIRMKQNIILEIGIGGYHYPDRGGAGLRVWSDYFERSQIYGIDLFDKSGIKLPPRTKIFQGSQSDGDFLLKTMSEIGRPDVIIDDASHINHLTELSFRHLFPWLKSGGIYVIEDIESSWWNTRGFDGEPDHTNTKAATTINFCKRIIDDINIDHITGDKSKGSSYSFISFYNNIVFIGKV